MVCRRPHGLLEASWFVGGVMVCRRAHGLLEASWFVEWLMVCRRAHVLFTLFVFVNVYQRILYGDDLWLLQNTF
jgi:hypothetical protein